MWSNGTIYKSCVQSQLYSWESQDQKKFLLKTVDTEHHKLNPFPWFNSLSGVKSFGVIQGRIRLVSQVHAAQTES